MSAISNRVFSLLIRSDTTPTRFFLACAALAWAVGLLLPGDTFDRPVYRYMKLFGADENAWVIAWLTYACLMFWRIFSITPRQIVANAVNLYGLALFSTALLAIFFTKTYPFPAGLAPDFVTCLAAFWVFVRTGINSEKGWRVD